MRRGARAHAGARRRREDGGYEGVFFLQRRAVASRSPPRPMSVIATKHSRTSSILLLICILRSRTMAPAIRRATVWPIPHKPPTIDELKDSFVRLRWTPPLGDRLRRRASIQKPAPAQVSKHWKASRRRRSPTQQLRNLYPRAGHRLITDSRSCAGDDKQTHDRQDANEAIRGPRRASRAIPHKRTPTQQWSASSPNPH